MLILYYLFTQESQKKALFSTNTDNLCIVGVFESYSRKKAYISGVDKDRMEKHFPLHPLLTKHSVEGLKKLNNTEAINFLKIQGVLLEKNYQE